MLSLAALLTLLVAQDSLPKGPADPKVELRAESTPQDSEDRALRTAARGLAYLEKEGVAWTKKNNCSSCHHVPMMLWAQREGRQRGLTIHEEARESAVAFALKAPFTGFYGPVTPEKLAQMPGPSLEIIYLALGLDTADHAGDAAQKLGEFKTHLLDKQDTTGAWVYDRKEKGKLLPPIEDSDTVVTMLSMLALSRGNPSPLGQPAASPSLNRALAWLRESAVEESDFSTALGVVTFRTFGMADRVKQLTSKLLSDQREDGGWAPVNGRPSDALATGQALYALADAGIDAKVDAIERGRGYLVRTQQADGSWHVLSRVPKNEGKPEVPGYFGSAWAVLGLVHHQVKE